MASWGYDAVAVSVLSGEGLDRLTEALRGRVTVVAGPSGAGKSSIINALRLRSLGLESALGAVDTAGGSAAAGCEEEEEAARGGSDCGQAPEDAAAAGGERQQRPQDGAAPPLAGVEQAEQRASGDGRLAADLRQRQQPSSSGGGVEALLADLDLQAVGSVSQRIGRGRHTTRNVTLLELEGSGGGLVVDTPGFNQPTLGMPAGELAQHFPEIRRLLEEDRWGSLGLRGWPRGRGGLAQSWADGCELVGAFCPEAERLLPRQICSKVSALPPASILDLLTLLLTKPIVARPRFWHIMASRCAFRGCQHLAEPGCVVREAGWERYPLYAEIHAELKLLEEVAAQRQARWAGCENVSN